MNDHEIVLAIQELLDGVNWDDTTLGEIANILADNGYRVAPAKDEYPDYDDQGNLKPGVDHK